MDYSDVLYNEYVMGERDYHDDLQLREWEFHSLYAEEIEVDDDEEQPETD